MPLDVEALTALRDLAVIAESGVDARTLDDVVVPAWVSVPYDEHLTQPLLRPEAPELAEPPRPLLFPVAEPGFAAPARGLAGLLDSEVEEAWTLDRLPYDLDAPDVHDRSARVGAAARSASSAVAGIVAGMGTSASAGLRRVVAEAGATGRRVRRTDVPALSRDRARSTSAGVGRLLRDLAADVGEEAPRLVRLGAAAVCAGLVAGVLAPVLAPEQPGTLSALSVLASASPLAFDPDPQSPHSGGVAPAPGAPSPARPVSGGAPAVETPAQPSPEAPAEAGATPAQEAGPLDVLRAALSFAQDPPDQTGRALPAAVAGTLPARSGTGRRLVLGSERAWAVAADGSVVRTWTLTRGTCLAPGTYRVRNGAPTAPGVRAVVWAGRDGARPRPVHGVAAGKAPCGAASPADARWLRTWSSPGSVVVVMA